MIFPLKFSLFSLGGVSLISLCCIPLMTSKGDKQTQKPLEQSQADSPQEDIENDEQDEEEESASEQETTQKTETTTVATGTGKPTDTTSVPSPANASPGAPGPQTGLQASYVLSIEEKLKEIEEGRKQFEQFTKTGNMPASVNKVRKYFESKGWPQNPWTKYQSDVSDWCYSLNIGCPLWYYGMNNIYGWYSIRWDNPPAAFKGWV